MATSVYITNHEIQVVMGSGSDRKVKVKKVWRLPISEGVMMNGVITNETQLAEEMAQYWKEYRLPLKELRLVIDSGKIMTKIIEVPYMKDKELLQVIAMEFQDAEREEEQLYDYFPLKKEDPYSMNELFCAALDKSVLESYLQLFAGLKLQVISVNIGLACLLKTVFGTGMCSGQTCILMRMEGDNVASALFEQGRYIYSRRNRLFNEVGSPERARELAGIVSEIQQFQVSRRNTYVIDRLYLSGFEKEELSELESQISYLRIRTELVKMLPGVSFPQQEMAENGMRDTVSGDYLYSIGNLMG